MIHIRPSERAPVEPSRFNEAYMMHGSTSPFYPMIACLDVAAAMMDGPGGLDLVNGAISEAIQFRKRIVTLGRELATSPEVGAPWFFGVWQPDEVHDPVSDTKWRRSWTPQTSCWRQSRRAGACEPDQSWHGFGELDSGLLHARSHQGHAYDSGHRRCWPSRRERDPRPSRGQLSRQPSRRGRKDRRLQPARAVLHWHDEGQVGDAPRGPSCFQTRL